MRQRLDVADAQTLFHDHPCDLLSILPADQRPRMTRAQFATADQLLNALRELQQPQHVGKMAAALSNDLGQLILGVTETPNKLLISSSLFDRIKVRALNILNDCEFERLLIAKRANDRGQSVQPGHLRRAPAAFARDDLIVNSILHRTDNERLNQSLFTN